MYVSTDVDDVMAIKPNFLTSMDYHIFLTLVLRARAPSAINSEKCSRIEGLSDTGTMPVKKEMAVDHLQSVAKHNFISPIIFGSNLVMYSIARSRMAVDIYGNFIRGVSITL